MSDKDIRRIILASNKERKESIEERLDVIENEMRYVTMIYERRMTVLLNERTAAIKALTQLVREETERRGHEND